MPSGGIAALVLAAGRGSRFGAADGSSKVLAVFDGESLVRRVVQRALASQASSVVVVAGYASAAVERALNGLGVTIIENRSYDSGLASSLRAGLEAVPEADGAVVLLADMPLVSTDTIDRLISTFLDSQPRAEAVVPVFEGRRGNPVLIGRSLFASVAGLRGDEGARRLIDERSANVLLCPVDDPGIEIDVDTRDSLRELEAGVAVRPRSDPGGR